MPADETTGPRDSHRMDTPIYDAMVRALTTAGFVPSGASAGGEPDNSGDTDTEHVDVQEKPIRPAHGHRPHRGM